MAIKFSAKDQTPPVAVKPAKATAEARKPSAAPKAADDATGTDLFKSPAEASRKTRKK